ncbi:YfiR/HmsC family protein [Temperatibacter marinus]|uniref:histidine kinase n=1 Tax=Temperatibacter marinus TaxID=1456591 RepID=A0AA52EGL8_9PROT|nr:YfiR/HmsC family protein [Temperatibacter marinus]WND01706.1 YfiR/HmsC family protein [Temperatibacter marinus]
MFQVTNILKSLAILIVAIFLIGHKPLLAQSFTPNQIKAELTLRFIDYFSWPQKASSDQIIIGVFEDEDLYASLLKAQSANRIIAGNSIRIISFKETSDIPLIDIAFIAYKNIDRVKNIARRLRGSYTLVITDELSDTSDYMINYRQLPDTTIAFDVNKANIILERLTMDTDILLLGGTELDIATLYREMENKMAAMAENFQQLEADSQKAEEQLTDLQRKLALENAALKKQEKLITLKDNELKQKENEISNKTAEIREKERAIYSLQKNNSEAVKTAEENKVLLGQQIKSLERSRADIDRLKMQEEERQRLLLEQQERIESDKEILNDLENNITFLTQMTAKKDIFLFMALAVSVIFLILVLRLWKVSNDRKIAQFKLLKSNEELEEKVLKRTENMAKARDEAIKANHAKSDFLANMSHEFRTPLNAVIGFSESILHGIYGEITSEKMKEPMNHIHQSGTHLLGIVNQILDLSKVTSDQLDLQQEYIPISETVDEIIGLLSGVISEKNIEIRNQYSKVKCQLYTDKLKFNQILINLLSNAVKFSEAKSVVEVTASLQQDKSLKITIRDYGCGIPSDKLSHIFEPFYQVHGHSHLSHEGTGLGLSIVSEFTKCLEGSITIDSQLDKGTIITLTFPERLLKN